jgi:hypothetical protein
LCGDPERHNNENGRLMAIAQLPGCSRAQSFPENQAQIEGANVNQLPL